jgi:hypothetical protein
MVGLAEKKVSGRHGHFHKPDFHKAGLWFGKKVSSIRSRTKSEKADEPEKIGDEELDEAERKLYLGGFYDPYGPFGPFDTL